MKKNKYKNKVYEFILNGFLLVIMLIFLILDIIKNGFSIAHILLLFGTAIVSYNIYELIIKGIQDE